MSDLSYRKINKGGEMSFSSCLEYRVPEATAKLVWENLGKGQVFITRRGEEPFTFASGQQATLKADAERLLEHPEIISTFLELYAHHPCIIEADVLSFVPNGVADFTDKLGKLVAKPVIRMFRPAGVSRSDIRFLDTQSEMLAKDTKTICLIEDISTTGFSAHATAKVLRAVNPSLDIHSLSMLQRSPVELRYQEGPGAVVYHTFIRQDLPFEIDEFRQKFPSIPVQIVA